MCSMQSPLAFIIQYISIDLIQVITITMNLKLAEPDAAYFTCLLLCRRPSFGYVSLKEFLVSTSLENQKAESLKIFCHPGVLVSTSNITAEKNEAE